MDEISEVKRWVNLHQMEYQEIEERDKKIAQLSSALKERDALLEKIAKKQQSAIETCRREGFVFYNSGGRWEKLAFTFYSDLAEIKMWIDNLLHSAPKELK